MEKIDGIFAVSASRVLPAKRWQVLRLLTRVQEFPRYLPSILECKVLSRERNRVVSSWLVEMEKVPIAWKEEEILDLRQFMIRFRALEGDLEKFEGCWKLVEHPSGGTELFVEATIKLGIPVFEIVAGGIIAAKIQRYFDSLLKAFEEELSRRRYHGLKDRNPKNVSGFAVIGHPYNLQHLIDFFEAHEKGRAIQSPEFLSKVFELTPSFEADAIREFRSANGKTVNGSFIVCNIIPDMLDMDIGKAVRKVVDACKLAERRGFGIVALGGFTSIAGERFGDDFLKMVSIPVTTGNTLTAALAVEQVKKAAQLMGLDLSQASVTILGGAGDIGSACARGLADQVREITVTSRTGKSFGWIKKEIAKAGKAKVRTSLNNREAVKNADIVIAAASAHKAIVDVSSLKPGAIVCDIGYPKNISYSPSDRQDILVFSGGICEIPCEFRNSFDHGLPNVKILYGCFSEAIVLALEERFERFSWGKGNITKEKMAEILGMAAKHGFRPAPFFWGERLLQDDEVKAIRSQVA
jgi:predicted amino acid dehydrogenase/ribosome-associated toxin RatA of RatAB toxin-antitoxin module